MSRRQGQGLSPGHDEFAAGTLRGFSGRSIRLSPSVNTGPRFSGPGRPLSSARPTRLSKLISTPTARRPPAASRAVMPPTLHPTSRTVHPFFDRRFKIVQHGLQYSVRTARPGHFRSQPPLGRAEQLKLFETEVVADQVAADELGHPCGPPPIVKLLWGHPAVRAAVSRRKPGTGQRGTHFARESKQEIVIARIQSSTDRRRTGTPQVTG